MDAITIIRGDANELDLVKALWEKLIALHQEAAPYFKERFQDMNWDKRKKNLLDKSGKLLFEYVIDTAKRTVVGYCISTVDKENGTIGELDSIFLDKEYRRQGIGQKLMENALEWLRDENTEIQKLTVGIGNDSVIDFYKQFDFFPLQVILQRKKPV